MSWLVTFLAGILGMATGMVGMFAIANACVKWYSISSFEGASGFYIVGLSLLGALGGFILSIIAARVGYSYMGPLWYSQLSAAVAVVLIALAIVWACAFVGAGLKGG